METLAFNITEKVLGRLLSQAYQEISSTLSVQIELDKLKQTLETITLVLQDAERKQMTNPLITHWLRKLKDVCDDIDDVLDDFEYQKLRMQVLNLNVKGKVCNFFSCLNSLCFRNKISHKIKYIREKLDDIDGEKNKYSLVPRDAGGDSQGVHKEVRDETYSHVQLSDVIGRDSEAKHIIGNLLKANSEGEDNVSVISVVGLGGLGKTTLAKLVYNNERVVEEFELKMWVCVSDEFLNKRLICEIINLATDQKCDTNESLQQMQIKFQNGLQSKKFLLVLDDVWDKEQVGVTINKWDEFKSLLNIGSRGSKIIITTRSENVATLTGSTQVHKLKVLPHKDCMSLFKRMASIKKDEEQRNPQLMEIAEDIVNKCGGVPLALATVGSSLRWKRDLHDWKSVRDNDIWKEEGILPALKLSYDALPLYLKPCFAYCSLFPKDHEFSTMQLVPLWMAEGYLQSSDKKQGIEIIGVEYIRQLHSRSLFQNIGDTSFDIVAQFKMHDLVHDLAISVAHIECSSMNSRPSVASERVRHVSLSQKDFSAEEEHVRESILQLHKVRTIVIPEGEISTQSGSFFKTCISRFEHLRVLDLNCSIMKVIPDSIGNLSHLRYLKLHCCMIEKLPDSICKLYNLESLSLYNCFKLKELPKNIGNLINLKLFRLNGNQMQFLPKGIECFTSLQSLVIVDCLFKSLGEGIQCLTNLRMLAISDCGNLESLPLNAMKCLTKFETLCIEDCQSLDLDQLEGGIPGLRLFVIANLELEALPRWLHDSASSLQGMLIYDCENLSVLPEWLQDFKVLQKIEIVDCPNLLAMPKGMHHFTALRELNISRCPELIKRCSKEEGEDWPKIAHVTKVILDQVDVQSMDIEDTA